MANEKSYQAIVEKIIRNGRHGPYAVAHSKELDSITFSLDRLVWQEDDWPEPGMYVMLTQVRRKRAGWRANRGRFVIPSDEQPATSTEQPERSNER